MKKLLIVVMACYGLNARSQVNESQNFVQLYSDSVIHAQKIRLRPDFLGSWSLRADSRKVPLYQVKFFSNEDGLFANTRKLNFFDEVSFSERVIEGKINLYQQVAYDPVPFEDDYHRFNHRRQQLVDNRMFYNKGYSDLKKVSYANLSMDMADNVKSLDLLAAYKKSRKTATIMYVGAGAAIIAGMVTFVSGSGFKRTTAGFGKLSNYEPKGFTSGLLLMGLGTGLGLGGYVIQASGARNIERAIDVYNQ